jgi:urease subunit alpha
MTGPTAGDLIELADTGLVIRVEADAQRAGDEFRTGFGKTARDGMHLRAATATETCDIVITNVTLLDPVLGVRTVSIGVRAGRISAIGRAGNPDTLDGVDVVVGTGTTIIPGEGLLATPGAVDTHVHLLSPRVLEASLSSGVTTVIGQEIGPVWGVGLNSPWLLRKAFAAFDQWPVNIGFLARGSSSDPAPLVEGLAAGGACGFKVHEDLGAHPRCLDTALTAACPTRSRWPAAAPSTPSTSRAAAAGTPRTCWNWPAGPTSSPPRPTPRCRSAGTRWPSTWT